MLTKTRSKRTDRSFNAEISSLEKQMLNHTAWQGEISLSEAALLLDGQKPYTFVLSSGFDRQHYIMSFVSEKNVVKHKNIRIVVFEGKTCFMNGGTGIPCSKLDDLIVCSLKVSANVCQPLSI